MKNRSIYDKTIYDKIISIDMLNRWVKSSYILIDVRDRSEYLFGHIPDAVNMTEKELVYHLSELREKERVIIICDYGNKSLRIVKEFMERYKVDNFYSVVGGYNVYRGLIIKGN